MNRIGRAEKSLFVLMAIAAMSVDTAVAQVSSEPGPKAAQASAVQRTTELYWTPDTMALAVPRTMVTPSFVTDETTIGLARQLGSTLVPGFGPGATPAMAQRGAVLAASVALPEFMSTPAPMTFGVAPADPLDGFTGPFQRFGQAGRYLQYPISTVGKLFFTFASGASAGNYVCSATAINRSTYVTAAHCNSDGNGVFATNRLFCPSWTPGVTTPLGNPGSGCWSGVASFTPTPWHFGGDPDYDYACVVTATTGSRFATKMGNITGWAARGWNWNDQLEVSMGYPQAPPFNGNYMHANAAPQWYDVDFTAGGPASKVQGNDLTGGSSGGPWVLGYANGSSGAETADVDNRTATDPGFFAVNGVNSHKRCKVNCGTPVSNAAGVFVNEMSSPRFRLDPNDTADSEDVFAFCFANANNNP